MRAWKRSVRVFVVACLGVVITVVVSVVPGGAAVPPTTSESAIAREPVDLLYISDSSGWGVASVYGRRIEHALGARVRVHDEWGMNLSLVDTLRSLRDPTDRWIPLVRDAEVLVVYGNPIGLEVVKGGDCVTSTKPPRAVGPELWMRYVAGMKALYKRIFEIRKGRPVILRTANWYVPVIRTWDEAGILAICTKKWVSFSAAIARAAAAYHVPVADVYRAFNGRGHVEDPVAKGYIQADGIHPNNKGRAAIAKALADLGYRQVRPRR